MKNFLPNQYKLDKKLKLNHNYLSEQFLDYKKTLDKLVNKFKENGIEKDVIEKLMFSNFKRLFNDND
jgi:predicted metal-dependent phosphotriesterase family hydrolase